MKRILFLFGLIVLTLSVQAQLTAPITESFTSSSTPTGWSQSATSGGPWIFSTSNNSVNCPAAFDHTGNSGNYAWMDQSGGDGGVILEMPDVNVASLTTPYLEFYYWMCGVGYTPPNLTYIETYDGTSWSVLDSITTATVGWQYYGYDLTGLTFGTNLVRIRFRAESGGSADDFYGDNALDDISIIEAPTCQIPTSLSASAITSSGATLSWNSVSNAINGYEVIYGVTGFDPAAAGTSAISTTNSSTLSALVGATTYDAYIIADCGTTDGISDTSSPVSFTTLCVPFTAPYARNFDADADGTVALCWEQLATRPNAYARVENLGTPRSGTQQLALYSGNGFTQADTLVAISPQFTDLTTGDKQVRFHAKTSNVLDTLYILSLSGSSPGSSATILDTVAFSAANAYTEVILPISTANGYNGTDTYIGLAMGLNGAATFTYIYVDDFNYEVVPACPKVSGLAVNSITATSVTLGFNTSGTSVDYEIGPIGFVQGTNVSNIITVAGNPITISALSPGTGYDAYVRNSCGVNGVSVWEGPVTFFTPCVTQTLPVVENFNNGPGCFTVTDGGGTADTWEVVADRNGLGLNGTSFFIADSDGAGPGVAMDEFLNGPIVDASTIAGTLLLTFDHFYQALGDSIKVEVYDGTNWVSVLARNTTIGAWSAPVSESIDVTAYANATFQVRFHYFQANYAWYWSIDNFTLRDVQCNSSSNLASYNTTSNSISVNWTPGDGVGYVVEYGLSGFSVGAGTQVTSLDSTEVITGLMPNTAYDIYVIDSCLVANSVAIGPITVTTACLPVSVPYLETFDTWPVACWSNTGSEDWVEYTGTAGDNYAQAEFYSFNSPANMVFQSPPVILNQYAQVGFDWSHQFNASWPDDQLLLLVRKASASTWDTIKNLQGAANFNAPGATIFAPGTFITESVVLDTNAYGLGDTIVAALWGNSDFGPDVFVNDFKVEALPPCPDPFNLTATSITASSASINATTYFGTSYSIEWGVSGFTQGTGTGTIVSGINTLPYNLTGLAPNTFYDVYIRVDCGSFQSVWVGPITFKTPCLAALSGTYTVGGAAGANNFATLDSAISVLNGCGVSGPVIFNLSGGVNYNRAVINTITGGSATNTVRFNGNLTNPDTIGGFELNGSDWVTLNNLYVRRTSGFNVWLHNQANNNTIQGCTLVSDQATTSSLNSNIALTGTATSFFTGGNHANNLVVNNNTFIGGYAALHSYGVAATRPRGIIFTNNTITNPYNYGIYAFQTDSVEVRNNTCSSMRSTFGSTYWFSFTGGSEVTGNTGYGAAYGLQAQNTNVATPNSGPMLIANNMFSGTTNAMLIGSGSRINIYHNTAIGNIGAYLGNFSGVPTNLNVRNNIFGSTGTQPALFVNGALGANSTVNYNAYDITTGSVASVSATVYATLAAWTTAAPTRNANSVAGTVGVVNATDYHLLGGLANNVGDNTVGILTDIDGDVRPAAGATTVDMGADEYTPVADDIAILSAEFDRNSACLTTNDTIVVTIQNTLGATKNFATNNLSISYTVTGPINTTGTFNLNTGTLALNATLGVRISGIDMSVPGNYTVDASIAPNAVNLAAVNDVLTTVGTDIVSELYNAKPDTIVFVNSFSDTVEIETRSPLFGGGAFHFTEICQFKFTTGAPTGGWGLTGSYPWLTADDYIEITGIPNSDLGGYTFEQFNASGLIRTYTFPTGTVLNGVGTCIIMTGELGKASDPLNFLYDARGTSTTTWSSGVASGQVLKDPSGTIVDAVSYGAFVFPASSGVTAADWSGISLTAGSTSGLRLEGPDLNNPSGWVVTGTALQNPNVVNTGVVVPAPANVTGFDWILNGTSYGTSPDTIVTNFTSSGTFYYIATYNSVCGVLTDTVTIVVTLGAPSCPTPANFTATVNSCDDVVLNWTGAGDSSIVAIAPAGGVPTTGNLIINDSTFNVTTGAPNTSYDVYISNICGGDTNAPAGPFTFSIADEGKPVASFIITAINGFNVDFDGTASTGSGVTYAWDFGDGTTGTGATPTHPYTTGGTFTIQLIVTNACGSDTATNIANSVSIGENPLAQTVSVYPNPTSGLVNITFNSLGNTSGTIRILELSGKEVLNVTKDNIYGEYSGQLDISKLATGVYMLEISSGDLKATRRLIKH